MSARRPDPAALVAIELILRERHAGQERAIVGRDLLVEAGYPELHLRRAAEAVQELRRRGVPVASTSDGHRGYYLAVDASEVRRPLRQLDSRIAELFRTRRALAAAVSRTASPQLGLFPGGVP